MGMGFLIWSYGVSAGAPVIARRLWPAEELNLSEAERRGLAAETEAAAGDGGYGVGRILWILSSKGAWQAGPGQRPGTRALPDFLQALKGRDNVSWQIESSDLPPFGAGERLLDKVGSRDRTALPRRTARRAVPAFHRVRLLDEAGIPG